MNISYFLTFIVVVEKGRFSEAAKALDLSQPAISFQIQALERHFGETLMERSGGKITLTPAGEIFLDYAKRIVAAYQELHGKIEKISADVTGRLVLEASTIPGEYILPRLIGEFMSRYPIVDVSLAITDSGQVVEHVLDRKVDIGFTGARPASESGRLVFSEFADDELVVVVPTGHPLGRRKSVTIREILHQPWLMREQGSGTRRTFAAALQRAGLSEKDLSIGMELGSNQAILGAVESNLGVSVLSRWAAERAAQVGAVNIVRVSDLDLKRRLYLVYDGERPLSRAQNAFLEIALAT